MMIVRGYVLEFLSFFLLKKVLNSSESTLLINELLFDYKRKDIKWIFKGRVISKLFLLS